MYCLQVFVSRFAIFCRTPDSSIGGCVGFCGRPDLHPATLRLKPITFVSSYDQNRRSEIACSVRQRNVKQELRYRSHQGLQALL